MNTPAEYDLIHLGGREYGNEIMRAVADEHFKANPELAFVSVWEHGGWHLGFRRDGSIWETANDGATCRGPFPQVLRQSIRRS